MRPARALLLLLLVSACSQPRRPLVPHAALDGPDAADQYYAMKRRGSADPQRAYAIARAQVHRTATIGDPPAAHLWPLSSPNGVTIGQGARARSLRFHSRARGVES